MTNLLVTGASSGIGKALVQLIAEEKKDITLLAVARRAELLTELEEAYPEKVIAIAADISTEAGRDKITKQVEIRGPLSFIVNNAGTELPVAPIEELTLAGYRASHATNTEGPLFLTKQLLTQATDSCRTLFVTSGAAYKAFHGLTAYACAKAALEMVCQSFQLEYQHTNLLFASLRPGGVHTDMVERLASYPEKQFALADYTKARMEGREKPLITPKQSAQFIKNVLFETEDGEYSRHWNINDADIPHPSSRTPLPSSRT